MTKPKHDLAAGFPPPDRAAWDEAVAKVLRGRDFGRVLVSETSDGLEIQPLYAEAGAASGVGASIDDWEIGVDPDRVRNGWDVRQRHEGDAAECNRKILEDLGGGVTSIELRVESGCDPAEFLTTALVGVDLDLAPLALAPHSDVDLVRAFTDLSHTRGLASSVKCWLGLDPLGGIARGDETDGLSNRMGDVAQFVAEAAEQLPSSRLLTVDATRYAEAGATEAQQLATSIATGVAYLRALEAAGLTPSRAAGLIGFRYAATADQFVTIAMLRSARRLWERVLESSGVQAPDRDQAQQAVTSEAMYSRRDPWVNLLRATSAALAAGVAGADSVTVLPFDTALGEPDDLGRRSARNIQMLLIEESNIARFVDPAAGSWFVDSLTARLSSMAWSGFQAIETAGGMAAVLTDESLAVEVSAAWDSRLERLSTREDPVTGVSEFPLLEDEPLRRVEQPASIGWPLRRLAAPFENLRDWSDRHLAEHGRRPMVFMAALGDLAVHNGRSTWVANLLAVAGIQAEFGSGSGTMSPIETTARFAESGCDVAVICSSDAVYVDRGVATAVALRDAGASMVVLAGDPGEHRKEFEKSGVAEFWYVGIDVLDTLQRLLGRLVADPPSTP